MAKVVSTKFGDRRLVNLPPVDLHGTKTPAVNTIEPVNPLFTHRTVPSPRLDRKRERGNVAPPKVVPKEYSYQEQRPVKPPFRKLALTGGNLVDANFRHIEETIMDQLTARYNAPVFRGYPMVPDTDTGQPIVPDKYMRYTSQAVQTMPTNVAPVVSIPAPPVGPIQHPPPPPPLQLLPPQQIPYPYPNVPYFGVDPNEKHVYYGPNGEILPGPPSWYNRGHIGARHGRLDLEDFDIQGTLIRGKLTTVRLSENNGGFPRIPEYLTKDLMDKYNMYEKTDVRIIAKDGQINVHATPKIKGAQTDQYIPRMPLPVNSGPIVQYMPVYIDDDGNVIEKGGLYESPNFPDKFPDRLAPGRDYSYAPPPIPEDRNQDRDNLRNRNFERRDYERRDYEVRDVYRAPPPRNNNSRIDTTPAFPPDGSRTPVITTIYRRPITDDPDPDGYRWRLNDSRYAERRYDDRRQNDNSRYERRYDDTLRRSDTRPDTFRRFDRRSTADVRPVEPPDSRALRF